MPTARLAFCILPCRVRSTLYKVEHPQEAKPGLDPEQAGGENMVQYRVGLGLRPGTLYSPPPRTDKQTRLETLSSKNSIGSFQNWFRGENSMAKF